jgi:phosphatidylserine decarboxylase
MIAKEGFPFITIGLVLAGIFFSIWRVAGSQWNMALGCMFSVITLWVVWFFRDPDRVPASADSFAAVSPADGKVIAIDTLTSHEFIGEPTTKISIFLNVFDVHVNRMPLDGSVAYVNYHPGKFFVASLDKASEENERCEIGMTTRFGNVVVKQIAGLIARRIVCRLGGGETVARGQRFGLIRFGSRTELFVPASATVSVAVGDRVKGGETILALMKASAQSSRIDRVSGQNVEL